MDRPGGLGSWALDRVVYGKLSLMQGLQRPELVSILKNMKDNHAKETAKTFIYSNDRRAQSDPTETSPPQSA